MSNDLFVSVDGTTFRLMAEAARTWLRTNEKTVDALNVFPVPDGDTGKNMQLTMRAACDEMSDLPDTGVGSIAHEIAEGAVMGARGNSGVILSQILRGMSVSLRNLNTFGTVEFASAMGEAAETAYLAVGEPMEGTILTVIKDAAKEGARAAEESADMITFFERVVLSCEVSVKRTPTLLPVLDQIGVIDAGGFGLLLVFEGMLRYLRGQSLEEAIIGVSDMTRLGVIFTEEQEDRHALLIEKNKLSEQQALEEELTRRVKNQGLNVMEPGQEWEVVVSLRPRTNVDPRSLFSKLKPLGTSIQIGQGDDLYHVHIHLEAQKRYDPIELAETLGTVVNVHMENLLDQLYKPGQLTAVVVSPGPGFTHIFSGEGVSVVSGGQDMNPSVTNLLDAFDSLPVDQVIILPNNKNIQMAAEQAAHRTSKQVLILPTRTVAQGISAMLAFSPDGNFDEVYEKMYTQIGEVETGEVTTAKRSLILDDVTVEEGQFIGLHNGTLICASDSVKNCALDLLGMMVSEDIDLITLYYGNGVEGRAAETLAVTVQTAYPELDVEVHSGGQLHYHYIMSAE